MSRAGRSAAKWLAGLAALVAVRCACAGAPGPVPGQWLAGCQPTTQAWALMAQLEGAADEGLDPADYGGAKLRAAAQSLAGSPPGGAQCAQFEARLQAAAGRYVRELRFGRVSARLAGFELPAPRAPFDERALLARAASATDVARVLAEAEPPFLQYRLLGQALRRYRELARLPEPLLPDPGRHALHEGDAYAGAPALRQWLQALGDLPQAPAGSATAAPAQGDGLPRIDAALAGGLRRFQARHGLAVDGALGRQTAQALRTPLAARVRQLELTMERWRWLPAFDRPPFVINIPQFRLFVFEGTDGQATAVAQMPVIVGHDSPQKRTPVFASEIRALVFRPYWDVPLRIAKQELLPQLARRPDYFTRHGFELVAGDRDDSPVVAATAENLAALQAGSLRLRQRPGNDNALGLLKFVMPNDHGVYLHGTAEPRLFGCARRDFSHGCIRVADPALLARRVLQGTPGDWSDDAIAAALKGPDNQRVTLARPQPVFVLYGTAIATGAGEVQFFADLYGLDRRLERLLRQRRAQAAP